MAEKELPKGDACEEQSGAKPNDTPRLTDNLTATTSAAVAAVENPNLAVTAMKERLTKCTHTSQALLDILEPMPKSKTGVGVRAKDGVLYEVVFIWDRYGQSSPMLYLRRMLRVDGPSLDGTFETESAFYIASFDGNPLGSIQQETQRKNRAFECQKALANNSALAGRLSVGKKHESGIKIMFKASNNCEFMFYLCGNEDVAIYKCDTHYPVPGSFDPNTVTLDELDEAIDRSSKSAA